MNRLFFTAALLAAVAWCRCAHAAIVVEAHTARAVIVVPAAGSSPEKAEPNSRKPGRTASVSAAAEELRAYIDVAGIAEDRKGFLFRTSKGHHGTTLALTPMAQNDAWRMIRKRAAAVGIFAPIGNHSFRATGITAYLANGGALEHAQEMAAHESPRTTKLYDRTKERLTQDEVERIRL